MTYWNTMAMSLSDIAELYSQMNKSHLGYLPKGLIFDEPVDNSEESDNLIFNRYVGHFKGVFREMTRSDQYPVKLSLNDGGRVCLIRGKQYTDSTHTDTTDYWFIFSNKSNAVKYERRFNSNIPFTTSIVNLTYPNNPSQTPTSIEHTTGEGYPPFTSLEGTTPYNRSSRYVDAIIFEYGKSATPDMINHMQTLFNHSSLYDFEWNTATTTISGYNYSQIYPVAQYFTNASDNECTIVNPVRIPDFMPVFDLEDVNAIINFLDTGDRTGEIDIFDTENPPKIEVDNFSTQFSMFISKRDNTKNLYSFAASNRQFNLNSDVLAGQYGVYVLSTVDNSTLAFSTASNPVATFEDYVPDNQRLYLVFFGQTGFLEEDGHSSGAFKIWTKAFSKSEYGIQIEKVQYLPRWYESESYDCSRISVEGGYYYTPNNYSTEDRLTIKFRGIQLEDLDEIFTREYPDPEDINNNQSGTVPGLVIGQGLKTYKLSETNFSAINQSLWNTDWTTVFKSTTIDPIKCVITCKGIPFDISGSGADTVYLANREISTPGAVSVNPIHKYEVATYTIQPVYNNFVDFYYTKIHLYLPYIGWVDLPATEVMSKYAVPQLGLSGKAHTLKFTYLVDFVDGNCRCIISVDGTERYYFDGNCAIDIPVTSDNHTTAVSTSIKSGVASVMSLASAVVGVATDNPLMAGAGVVSTIQNASNIIPSYEFSATASSSGYINNSMNKHIMIIREYPNAFYPSGYNHKYGKPCYLDLPLSNCSGFTKTVNVDVSGINCTSAEADMIRELLDTGVYL